jgi:hypothetical protein
MTTDLRRFGQATTPVDASAPQPPLDYYLVFPQGGQRDPAVQAEGIVVEEFVLDDDYSAVGLNSAGWTPAGDRWWSSAAFSAAMRTDPELRARVIAVGRDDVEIAYRQFGAGELPDEATLCTYFHDYEPLAASAPLRLSRPQVPYGFHDRRVYRILFANELSPDRLANLRSVWQMAPADGLADPGARVIGSAHLPVANDLFTWDLRRIGPGVAWCLDLTAYLGGSSANAIGPVLRELTTVMRQHGLIPVTIERFS